MKSIKYIVIFFIFFSVHLIGQVDIKFLEAYNDQISDLIDNGNYELADKKTDSLFLMSKQINYTEGIDLAFNLYEEYTNSGNYQDV